MENIPIERYENLYEVSYDGRVFSKDKEASYKGQSYLKGRELKQELIKRRHTNYRRVTLSKNGEIKRFMVHQLVANAFVDNPENKPYVNHIDNQGENNYYYNLEWCTHSENMIHAQKQGRLDESLKKATEQAKQNKKIKICQKFTRLLGLRLIDIEYSRRTTVTFRCRGCETNYTARIDAPLFECEHIRCRKCKGK